MKRISVFIGIVLLAAVGFGVPRSTFAAAPEREQDRDAHRSEDR